MEDRYSVKLMDHTLRDLDCIYGYIARKLMEPETASEQIDALEAGILSLESMPCRCPRRQTGAYVGKGYRQLFVNNYTVIFRVDEANKAVLILTIRYSASQF